MGVWLHDGLSKALPNAAMQAFTQNLQPPQTPVDPGNTGSILSALPELPLDSGA